MELYKLPEDITVIGIEVTTFPNGVQEAFETIMKTLGNKRSYYGVSWCDENNTIKYFAMATAKEQDEEKLYNYEALTIPKGEYETEVLYNWLSKTECIKEVFHGLMANSQPGKNRPCIEWYKSDEEMLCMVKVA